MWRSYVRVRPDSNKVLRYTTYDNDLRWDKDTRVEVSGSVLSSLRGDVSCVRSVHKQHTDRTHASCTLLGPLHGRWRARVRFWVFSPLPLSFLRLPRTPHKTEPNAATSKPDLVAGDERYRSPCSFAFIIRGRDPTDFAAVGRGSQYTCVRTYTALLAR